MYLGRLRRAVPAAAATTPVYKLQLLLSTTRVFILYQASLSPIIDIQQQISLHPMHPMTC